MSGPIGELAQQIDAQLPDGPEKAVGMRKLLEAKDCFVRVALETRAVMLLLLWLLSSPEPAPRWANRLALTLAIMATPYLPLM